MDTIQDTPEETSGAGMRYSWTQKALPDGPAKPRGRPFKRKADWRLVALVGAGVAAGAALGAGIALLMAPQSGAHTRLALSREVRRRRPWRSSPWRSSPWEQLGEELHKAAHWRHNRNGSSDFDESV